MKFTSLIFALVLISTGSIAQGKKQIPQAVTDSFSSHYPAAQDVTYKDMLTYVNVRFALDSEKMAAKFSNKGEWKETTKQWSYEKLSPAVHDGFQKSKYAVEWKVKETVIVYEPGGVEYYRIRVEKNDLQKKYLYFDKTGRLIRDNITI